MKRQGHKNEYTKAYQRAKKSAAANQQLSIPTMSQAKKHCHDRLFAHAVFMSTLPFTIYEKAPMRAALKSLHPAYVPPDRYTIGNILLDEVYGKVLELHF
jgi:hypothetical protein